jgi:hypothetical protein
MTILGGGDCLAVNMSEQHVCVLQVRVRSSRRMGILMSDMAYGVVDPGFAGFPLSAVGCAYQLRLRPGLVYKVGCTYVRT